MEIRAAGHAVSAQREPFDQGHFAANSYQARWAFIRFLSCSSLLSIRCRTSAQSAGRPSCVLLDLGWRRSAVRCGDNRRPASRADDIITTLQSMGLIKYWKGQVRMVSWPAAAKSPLFPPSLGASALKPLPCPARAAPDLRLAQGHRGAPLAAGEPRACPARVRRA